MRRKRAREQQSAAVASSSTSRRRSRRGGGSSSISNTTYNSLPTITTTAAAAAVAVARATTVQGHMVGDMGGRRIDGFGASASCKLLEHPQHSQDTRPTGCPSRPGPAAASAASTQSEVVGKSPTAISSSRGESVRHCRQDGRLAQRCRRASIEYPLSILTERESDRQTDCTLLADLGMLCVPQVSCHSRPRPAEAWLRHALDSTSYRTPIHYEVASPARRSRFFRATRLPDPWRNNSCLRISSPFPSSTAGWGWDERQGRARSPWPLAGDQRLCCPA